MREIGGFFELGGGYHESPHHSAWAYNTSRNAFRDLLNTIKQHQGALPQRIVLPVFNCPDVAAMLQQAFPEIALIFYNINRKFDPILDGIDLEEDDLLYTVDYFGLGRRAVIKARKGSVTDSVHAFFRPPIEGQHSLYSFRKFFGVPDGAYLYTPMLMQAKEPWTSWSHCTHLLKRVDLSAQYAYADYLKAEETLSAADVAGMSRLSISLMSLVDIERTVEARLSNFSHLNSRFAKSNELSNLIDTARSDTEFVPFTFPLLINEGSRIRSELISRNIFTPTYWTGVLDHPSVNDFERHLALNTVHLPIDQRYGLSEMDEIIHQLDDLLA